MLGDAPQGLAIAFDQLAAKIDFQNSQNLNSLLTTAFFDQALSVEQFYELLCRPISSGNNLKIAVINSNPERVQRLSNGRKYLTGLFLEAELDENPREKYREFCSREKFQRHLAIAHLKE